MSDAFGEITDATPIFVDSKSTSHDSGPRGIAFNTDGTKMFVVGRGSTDVGEYTCDVGFDVSSCNYASVSKDVGTEDGKPTGLAFNTDGTKMFVTGNSGDDINEYICTTGFDVTSCDLDTVDPPLDVRPEGKAPMNVAFNTDGTKMFVAGAGRDNINEYICTTGFDVSSCTFEDEFDLEAGNNVTGLAFSTDGTKMFTTDRTETDAPITEYTCDVGFDVSSCNYVDDFFLITWDDRVTGIAFNTDGTKLFVLGDRGNDVNEFTLSCAFQIIGTCGEEKKQRSGACGFDRDCTAPRITKHGMSETPDGFSINDNIFVENQEFFNKNPTIQGKVGEPVTIKMRAWENMGTERINLIVTYLEMYGEKPDWRESQAFIEYHIVKNQLVYQDDNGIFFLTGASSEKITNPYGDNDLLEVLDITFTIIFAKPMEPSHIGIQTIDYMRNYELVYFENALEILPKEIIQVEEIPEPVTEESIPEESIPEESIPEESIPEESEPPIKEPEPEVMLTASTEKSVLSFVDEDLSAKHYVKRYITEEGYRQWFDTSYSEYEFWEGIGITQETFDKLTVEVEFEPEPRIIQTGFVLVPDNEEIEMLVEEKFEPEPPKLEPIKEKKGFWEWLFGLFI